jgi:hypothetical protein
MRRRRSIVGPIVLITVGVLFALDYSWSQWEFSRTWPVILVVIGLVKLFERMVWDDHGYYYDGRQWGPGAPAGTTSYPTSYPGAVPPPPATSQAAPPPPPQPPASSSASEYPAYPTYPTSSSDTGDGHAS